MSLTKNMAEIAKWRKFANAIKAKRTNAAIKNNSKSGGKVSNNGCQCDVSILEKKGTDCTTIDNRGDWESQKI
jgi:hypothetical protein